MKEIRKLTIITLITIVLFLVVQPKNLAMATVEILRPNAAGDEMSVPCQVPGPGEHWDKVDDTGMGDGDNTYVTTCYMTGVWYRDLYNLPNPSAAGPINKITVYARIGGHARITIETGGSIYESPTIDSMMAWTLRSYEWTTNPQTGLAWTWSDINALQIGVNLYGQLIQGVKASACTQVYVEVDYTSWVLPIVSTSNATNVASSQATLNGNITNTGGNNADKRGFEWGTSPGSYSGSWTESGSFGAGAFSHNITGLNPNTNYYFRAKAHNSAGWSYGSEISFTTNQSPVIDSFSASPTSGEAPLTVTFTCTAHDPDGTIASYQWDFDGNGTADTTTATNTTSYTYYTVGTYQAKVTVVDNYGAETTSVPVTITVGTVPGDCNSDGKVSIDEIQKAINCFLGKQNACCDKCDLDSNGTVSIDEVQRVINAYLGK